MRPYIHQQINFRKNQRTIFLRFISIKRLREMPVTRIFTGLLTAVSLLISSTAWAFTIPSGFDLPNDTITPSGTPAFYHDVKVKLNNRSGRLSITGHRDFYLEAGGTVYTGEKLSYDLLIFHDGEGGFLSGTLELSGILPELDITQTTLLVTAEIDEWNLHDDSNLWGFGTTNIVCSPLLEIQIGPCTTNESIYVPIPGEGFDMDFSVAQFSAEGYAVTTVPVPAAILLFGSALGLLGWTRRKAA
jgi:hypothetical protein